MNLNIPPVTQSLILVNIGAYFGMTLLGGGTVASLALWPLGTEIGPGFWPWQLVSYSFLHADLLHLFFNMFALFMFGCDIERTFGGRWYLGYYFACVVSAAVAQLAVAALTSAPPYPTVGASGGVFGILLAFGMYFPRRTIVLLIPPIPMPAWLFVTIFGVLELYFGVTGTAPGVAHFAHLGGMVGGYIMIRQRRGRRRR